MEGVFGVCVCVYVPVVVVVADGGCAVFACCAVGLCGVVLRGLQTQTILLDPRLEQLTGLDRSIYHVGYLLLQRAANAVKQHRS
jgi:hypothetical protein